MTELIVLEDFLISQLLKNPPAVQETPVQSLGWEGPLEDGIATHSSGLAWRIPWTDDPGGLQPLGSKRATKHSTAHSFELTKIYLKNYLIRQLENRAQENMALCPVLGHERRRPRSAGHRTVSGGQRQ